MPIKGLTKKRDYRLEARAGTPVRIGVLQKGRRTGEGRSIKLHDDPYFNFRPTDDGETGEEIAKAFHEVYGSKPEEIPDVRIAASLAGNFDIANCAWLTASRHTKIGSTFLGQSDGQWVRRLRDPETGRIIRYEEGELSHDELSPSEPKKKYGRLKYRGKFYDWTRQFAVDLILPDLNRVLFSQNLAGLGVVSLRTSATYDIGTLEEEYYNILDTLVTFFSPGVETDIARKYIPLRNIPLRLFRRVDSITTPNWKTGDSGDRMPGTRSLLHWTLNAKFSEAMQTAADQRTISTIEAIATQSFLSSGPSSLISDQPVNNSTAVLHSGKSVNDDLFGFDDETTAAQKRTTPEPENEPDFADLDNAPLDEPETDELVEEGDFEDVSLLVEPEYFEDDGRLLMTDDEWLAEANSADTLDAWAYAIFQTDGGQIGFPSAKKVRSFWEKVLAVPYATGIAHIGTTAVGYYVTLKADGAPKSATEARTLFGKLLAEYRIESELDEHREKPTDEEEDIILIEEEVEVEEESDELSE